MGNSQQILDKVSRNLDQLGISNSRAANGVNVIADSLVISYEDADIQAPVGGVSPDVSPYLGLGIGNPGQIKIKGDAGENTLADIWTSEARMRILRVCSGHANDIIVEAGDTTAELARMPGHQDLLGMGM
jgi:hypothetical protein